MRRRLFDLEYLDGKTAMRNYTMINHSIILQPNINNNIECAIKIRGVYA